MKIVFGGKDAYDRIDINEHLRLSVLFTPFSDGDESCSAALLSVHDVETVGHLIVGREWSPIEDQLGAILHWRLQFPDGEFEGSFVLKGYDAVSVEKHIIYQRIADTLLQQIHGN